MRDVIQLLGLVAAVALVTFLLVFFVAWWLVYPMMVVGWFAGNRLGHYHNRKGRK